MIESNLIKQVFIEPIKGGADTLLILSGYATPNMVSLLIKKLQEEKYCIKDINLIVGMTAYNGISISNHRGFLELHNQYFESGTENFSCSYIYDGLPVHSNLYIWLKEDMPQIAFTGSASFIQPAFTGRRKEILSECNAEAAYKIYEEAERNSIYCNLSEVEDNVIIYKDKWIDDIDEGAAVLNGAGIKSVKLSLLTKNGTIGKRSGLNWGQRPNRNKNEAYIGVPAKIARSGFFPSNEHFSVITDDNHFLILLV